MYKQGAFFILVLIVFSALISKNSEASERINDINNPGDSITLPEAEKKPDLPLTPYHLNVIKFNPTPMLLFGEVKNVTFSYERLIKKNQSMSFQLGYLLLPKVLDDTIFNTVATDKLVSNGINISVDYRIYPFARNRRPAPDGMYYGGYIAYLGTAFENKMHLIDGPEDDNLVLEGNMSLLNVGFELGYQFIFAKRFSIDLLLLGPSISGYWANAKLSGSLNSELGENIDEELADKLKERFPFLTYLFAGDDATFSNSKVELVSWFRYSCQFGYHF